MTDPVVDPITKDDLIPIEESLKTITDFIEDSQKPLVIDNSDFVDPTPSTPITDNDLSLYYELEFFENFDTSAVETQKALATLNKSVLKINDRSSDMFLSIDSIDEQFLPVLEVFNNNQQTIIENQQTIIENQVTPTNTDNTLVMYGLIIIPMVVILWILHKLINMWIKPFI